MYKQHTCSRENCPRKNWPTQQKDMDLVLEVLFNIMRSSIHKYVDYDIDKAVASDLIKEWGDELYDALAEYYSAPEEHHEIVFNVLLTLVEVYPDDGLPRKVLNELIANEKLALITVRK